MNCGFIKHLQTSTGQNKAANNQDIRWDYICFRTIYFQICDWLLSLSFNSNILLKDYNKILVNCGFIKL